MKKKIDGRMIVFHIQRKAMEIIDAYEKCQDEKLTVEQIPGYKKKFNNMKRRTKLKEETTDTPEEKKKREKKRKNRNLDNAIKEITDLKQRLKTLEHSLTVYKKIRQSYNDQKPACISTTSGYRRGIYDELLIR